MALTQTQVSELYVSIFNRASEGAGNEYWQTQGDLAEVANKMLGTDDAKAYFGDALNDDKAFVEWIYKNTFNKTYADDPGGIDHWVDDLAHGMTRGEVVANIVTAATAPENAGDAQDQFMNRVTVSNYLAEHFAGDDLATSMPDYKTKLGFDGEMVVTKDGQTVADIEHLIDSQYSDGKTITLTPDIDKGPDFAGTESSDTWTGDSSTVGFADVISDPNTSDDDHFNITATGDMALPTVVNVENIDINIDTVGQVEVDSLLVSYGDGASTITVHSDKSGFGGAVKIDDLLSNKVVAGENITNLEVNNITNGTVDAGHANTVKAEVATNSGNLNLIVNGDVAVTGLNTTGDLNIEATADSVVDVTDITFNNSEIKGDANVTIKSDSDEVDGETIKNSGTGTVTLELTDSNSASDTADAGVGGVNDVDMRKMDVSKAILDVVYNQELIINKDLEVTAKKAGNTATFSAADDLGLGGSTAAKLTLNLTQKADGNDKYTMSNIGQTNINVEKGGIIDTIDDQDGGVKINTANDLTVNTATLTGQALEIDGASSGKVTLAAIDAQAVIASDFTKDLNMTQSADAQIAVIGSQAKNNITLAAVDNTASVKTQDGVDTVVADSIEAGKLTVDTAGGNDTVTAVGMTTSKATFDLGAGNDTLTLKNLANGDATVNAGADNDTINVVTATAGKMVINGDAGNDIVDVDKANGALNNNADITVNGGDGDDVIYLHSLADSTETITVDGGAGSDIVEVTKEADFTKSDGGVGTSLTMTNIENLKIDELATFSSSQLNDQTFKVSSGTSGSDTLSVLVDKSDAVESEHITNLGDLDFSVSTSTAVEYLDIDATKSLSSDKIIGGHDVTNVIDITDADGTATNPIKNTIQLFADSIGNTIDNLQSGTTQPDVTTSMLQDPHANEANVSFDIAVITGFQSSKVDSDNKIISDDSLILGDAATSTNFKSIAAPDAFDGSKADKAGMEEYLANAISAADDQLAAHHDLEYVYVYDGHTTTANPVSQDAWLMWDSDGNHKVDAAILLVGVEPSTPDGTGFAASDIIAAS